MHCGPPGGPCCTAGGRIAVSVGIWMHLLVKDEVLDIRPSLPPAVRPCTCHEYSRSARRVPAGTVMLFPEEEILMGGVPPSWKMWSQYAVAPTTELQENVG